MRAITTEIKTIVGRLGPVPSKALELAIGATMRESNAEVTADHLLRAMLDLPDCDLSVAMKAAGVARVDVAARLDWHLRRLPQSHKGKPTLAPILCLLLQDAAGMTSDRVRTGHIAAALIADPSLSGADIGALLAPLPREPLHLLASRSEDRGEVGQTTAPVTMGETPKPPVTMGETPKPPARPVTMGETPKPPAAVVRAEAPKPAAATTAPPSAPHNLAALKTHFADRLLASDADGLTLSANVGGRQTKLRLAWDTDARVLVLRIALPADPPKDEVSAAIALSTLNNSLPHGAFVLDEGRLAFRSHVFLDDAGDAPLETVAFAARVCEQAADALGE